MNDIGFEQHLQKAWIKLNASCPLDKDNPSMEVFFYSEDSYNTNKQKYELVEYSIALITFDGKHHRYISSSPGSQDALVSCGATAFMTLYFLTP
ncbi:hypothetical protein RRG08_058315 [Elysia crispata]|uniref:Uncharacterized protein n=1 Tax=Elysia crispata TaxID=231223 RepID=A0AAE1D6A0_9GAST|nr:hypothetical protein RRG08_058315 [Elysia crispata]